LRLSEASGENHGFSVTLAPGQSQRINIREELGATAPWAFGGLSLSVTKDGALTASEIVFDEVTGLAAVMKLFDRDADGKVSSHLLRAPMMALSQPDPSLAFPPETILIPRIFLRNAGSTPLDISALTNWRRETGSGKFGRDLVAVAASYDKNGRYGLQTPFAEGTNRLFKGSMWHVDGTHNTLITTGNGGLEPTKAQVTLFYNSGQGKYRLEQLLPPGQQIWLDLGQLIRNQVPDSDGKTVPPDTMFGSYELRDLDHPVLGLLYGGKLIVDKTFGHASYGCEYCCAFRYAQLAPSPFTGPPGIDNGDIYQAYDVCNSTMDDFDIAYDWKSSNTAVATLPNSTLHTVAVGSATGSAENTLPLQIRSCPNENMVPQQAVTVLSAKVTLNSSGQVSATDGASTLYKGVVGTLNLGVLAGKLGTNNGCVIGNELVGTVTPSTSVGPVTVKRTLDSVGCYQGSSAVTCPQSPGDDTGDLTTTNPQNVTSGGSANGHVYNLDTPGTLNIATTTPIRLRANFTAFAVGPDGTTTISPSISYFVRISCMNNASGVAELSTGVTGDNQIGTGTTKTTWNLQ
jgi:hypothetical protein